DGAGLVLDGVEQDLDLVAGLGGDDLVPALVVPLVEGDDAFTLVTDVDPDFVADDVEDAARDDFVDLELLLLVRQPPMIFLALVESSFLELGIQFLVGQVELTEQIAIHHSERVPLGLTFPTELRAVQALWALLGLGVRFPSPAGETAGGTGEWENVDCSTKVN